MVRVVRRLHAVARPHIGMWFWRRRISARVFVVPDVCSRRLPIGTGRGLAVGGPCRLFPAPKQARFLYAASFPGEQFTSQLAIENQRQQLTEGGPGRSIGGRAAGACCRHWPVTRGTSVSSRRCWWVWPLITRWDRPGALHLPRCRARPPVYGRRIQGLMVVACRARRAVPLPRPRALFIRYSAAKYVPPHSLRCPGVAAGGSCRSWEIPWNPRRSTRRSDA
jgi:hypothetical protein